MPFKVKFQLFEPDKTAPVFQTADRTMAYVEWNARKAKYGADPMVRMVPDVTYIEGDNRDKYVWLVYRVRKAIQKYYGEGRKRDDLYASLDLEKQLDDWNSRTRHYLQTHPLCRPDDDKAFAFFQVVEEWRNAWHRYFAYKKRADKDPDVEREMKKQCFDFEKEIDKYIKLVIGL